MTRFHVPGCSASVLLTLALVTNAIPVAAKEDKLTVAKAREMIEQLIAGRNLRVQVRGAESAKVVGGIKFESDQMVLQLDGAGDLVVIPYLKLRPTVMRRSDATGWWMARLDEVELLSFSSTWNMKGANEDLAGALLVLRQSYATENAHAEDERLDQVIARYRGQPKPVFPEEAHRFRVQAEAAVRDKRFGDAAQRYGEALKVAPWWPEGRFNRALVLAEVNRFPEAIREMKRYLALVPEVSNARAAQDKIYEWEDKVGRKP